jgi:hypothetical protein
LKYKNWKTDVAFVVENIGHEGNLNVTVQGKDSLMHKSCAAVKAPREGPFVFRTNQRTEMYTFFAH